MFDVVCLLVGYSVPRQPDYSHHLCHLTTTVYEAPISDVVGQTAYQCNQPQCFDRQQFSDRAVFHRLEFVLVANREGAKLQRCKRKIRSPAMLLPAKELQQPVHHAGKSGQRCVRDRDPTAVT